MQKMFLKLHNKIFLITTVLIIVVTLGTILFNTFNLEWKKYSKTDVVMGTFLTQTVYAKEAENISLDVYNEIKNLENKISWRISSSDIEKINSAKKSQWIKVDKITLDSLITALEFAEKSNGAFDPTILPVSRLWNFTSEKKVVPLNENINNALLQVGYKNIKVDKGLSMVQKLTDDKIVDLGGVGKGLACDLALDIYKKSKIKAAVISAGGSIGIFGEKKNKEPFKIAIRDPFLSEDSSNGFAVLSLKNGCISTSGAYEQNFTVDNKFYHHILNTKTGYPVESNLASVTVYHEKGIITDILSTTCYILGKENSLGLLKEYNAEAVFVDQNRNVFVTDGLKDKIVVNENYCLQDW